MEVPPPLQKLGKAIASHPTPVRAVFCGFDLWLQVVQSGKIKMQGFKQGGELASGDEDENTIVVQFMVVGNGIVIGFDPSLPPDDFRLAS